MDLVGHKSYTLPISVCCLMQGESVHLKQGEKPISAPASSKRCPLKVWESLKMPFTFRAIIGGKTLTGTPIRLNLVPQEVGPERHHTLEALGYK